MLRRFAKSRSLVSLIAVRELVTVTPAGERIYSASPCRPTVLPEANEFKTLHHWFLEKMCKHHDQVALICATTDRQVTFADLARRSEQLANELFHTHNVRRGDTVAIVSPNTVDFGAAFHAILKLGAKVTTVNPLYSAEELRLQLDLSGAKAVITLSMFEPLIAQTLATVSSISKTTVPFSVLYSDRPLVAGATPVGSSELGFLHGASSDTIVIPFSSGTTGMPKGVQLTNHNLLANIYQTHVGQGFVQSDVALAVLPYFHIYGMVVVLHCMLNVGAKQVVFPKFDIVPYFQKLQQYKATMLFVAPPMIVGFVKHPVTQTTDRSSVRRVLSGAAPLHEEVQKMAEKLFPNGKVCQGYGLTETSPVATLAKPGLYGTAGAVLSDTEMRIIKIDNTVQIDGSSPSAGIDAAEGEEGEVWFRGPQVMKGYLRQEDTDKVMVKGGWFRTGDIGRVDPTNEHLIITDRLKELIKFKGFQVAPAELEGILQTHPLVLETVVVGVPDPLDLGCELPRAQVALKPGTSEADIKDIEHTLMKFVESHVAPYKKLRGGVRVVPAVPKSPAGKLLRRIAKAQEIEFLKDHPKFPHAHEASIQQQPK